jgi:hypothetical protein
MPFVIEGTLELSCNTARARFTGRQQHLEMDLDNPGEFVKAMGFAGMGGLGSLRQVAQTLHDYGLTLLVLNRGQLVMTLGYGARTGLSGYVVPHVQITAIDVARFGLKMITG